MRVILAFFASLLLACSTPPRYHILETTALPADPTFVQQEKSYALRETALPQYLQSQYLIYRDANGHTILDKDQLWGEELPDNLRRVLADMIAQRTGSNKIYLFPLRNQIRPERFIDVQIADMIADYRTQSVQIRATWQTSNPGERNPASHSFVRQYALASASPDIDNIVATYQKILADLSAAILPTL